MDGSLTRRLPWLACATALMLAVSVSPAAAQAPPPAGRTLVVGVAGALSGFHAECCDRSAVGHARASSLLLDIGLAPRPTTDITARLIWTPARDDDGTRLDATALLGAVTHRFWPSRGFYVSGAVGLAWVADLIPLDEEPSDILSAKGLAVDLAAGWEWRIAGRWRGRVLASRHVVALGDLPTSFPDARVDNLIINYWSVGAGIVVR